ncbi:MAG: glycosyltransferase family 4 protein [Acidobacteriota bacterium]
MILPASAASLPSSPATATFASRDRLPRAKLSSIVHVLILNWRGPGDPAGGGAEVYLEYVARGLVAAGHRVTWLCGGQAAGKPLELPAGLHVQRHGGRLSIFPRAALAYLRDFRKRVDLVIESVHGVPFLSCAYARVPKILLVHHVHREIFQHELPAPAAWLGRSLEATIPRLYRHDWFVAVSDSTRDELATLGVAADRLAIVHNGLDADRFRPGSRAERPTVLCLGRLKRYKSVDTLVQAAARWRRHGLDVHTVIAGDGPHRAALERLATELDVDRVTFTGAVDEEAKVRLLQQAHVVVQPSLKEGWGMTVIEANACGTPVVAAAVAGLRDSVRDGETGLLVPPGDPEALAAGVRSLFETPQRRAALGENAQRWAARFTWDRTATSWAALVAARGPGGPIPQALRRDLPKTSEAHRTANPTRDAPSDLDVDSDVWRSCA